MDINIDISPEVIERQIVDAVVKSGIGKRIETAVLASLSGYQFQKTVEEATTGAIATMVRDAVMTDGALRAKIVGAIVEKLTDEHVSKLLDKVIRTAI